LRDIHALSDFKHSGTRTVTAADYVYQINVSPIRNCICPYSA